MTTLIMPIAGLSSRYTSVGWQKPKPMLHLAGRTFVEWAHASALRAMSVEKTIFVARTEHLKQGGMEEFLRNTFKDAIIVETNASPTGAADDAFRAFPFVNPDQPVAVNDCDHAFTITGKLEDYLPFGEPGMVVVGFPSTHPANSYIQPNGVPGNIRRIVRKRVVGPVAVGGCYLFSSPGVFHDVIMEAQAQYREEDGLHMSAVINAGLDRHIVGRMVISNSYISFRTPEELHRVDVPRLRRMLEHE